MESLCFKNYFQKTRNTCLSFILDKKYFERFPDIVFKLFTY